MTVSEEEMDNIANEALEAVLGSTWGRGGKMRKAFNDGKRTGQTVLGGAKEREFRQREAKRQSWNNQHAEGESFLTEEIC